MNCNIASARPDSHAPIGVMRDHVHGKGEVMLSYRFEYMNMEGNRTNRSDISTTDILSDYMVAPTKMPMTMHMFGAMYGITDQLTISAMTGFMDKEMDHLTRMGGAFTAESHDWSDTKLNAMYEFYNDGKSRWQFNAGISLPTASIDERNDAGMRLPFPMQIGSGTYDLMPGISYSAMQNHWSWGGQLNATIRLGENDNDYTLGNRYQLTAWGARKLNDKFSVSIRLDGQAWDDIDTDNTMPMFMAPTMDPELQGGERIDALAGVNFIFPDGIFQDNRLALEIGTPIYQRLDGPRLETDYRIILGWQKSF